MLGVTRNSFKALGANSFRFVTRSDACNKTRGFHASALQQGGAIRVIMLDAVPGTGSKGEVVQVKRGYARNFLIPRKVAAYATDDNKKTHGELIASSAKGKTSTKGDALSKAIKATAQAELLNRLKVQIAALPSGWHIEVVVNATADGRLYGALASTDLVIALKDQHDIDCPTSAVDIGVEGPIKSLGKYKFTVAGQSGLVIVTSSSTEV